MHQWINYSTFDFSGIVNHKFPLVFQIHLLHVNFISILIWCLFFLQVSLKILLLLFTFMFTLIFSGWYVWIFIEFSLFSSEKMFVGNLEWSLGFCGMEGSFGWWLVFLLDTLFLFLLDKSRICWQCWSKFNVWEPKNQLHGSNNLTSFIHRGDSSDICMPMAMRNRVLQFLLHTLFWLLLNENTC